MDIGQKLKQARLEAGLSQRSVCGEEITRNMLSLIENGVAKPSMDTLRYLASRLQKPVSWFLEEDAVTSANQQRMAQARACWERKDYRGAASLLVDYKVPDETFDAEFGLLRNLVYLELAQTALEQGRAPYCMELLERVKPEGYCGQEILRRKLLLLAQADPATGIADCLPELDTELMIRAREALEDLPRAEALLEAVQTRDARWNLLRGRVYLARQDYLQAAACFHKAEFFAPEEAAPLLETCYRELEDYKMAYYYACKGRP